MTNTVYIYLLEGYRGALYLDVNSNILEMNNRVFARPGDLADYAIIESYFRSTYLTYNNSRSIFYNSDNLIQDFKTMSFKDMAKKIKKEFVPNYDWWKTCSFSRKESIKFFQYIEASGLW